MATSVSEIPAADSNRAAEHFGTSFEFETDCWDVHQSTRGTGQDFVLLDVRSEAAFRKGHIDGAIHQHHSTISEESMNRYAMDTLFVAYCAGPHCNGAHRAATTLAKLGRPVKIMIGGITGWLDEGFKLKSDREHSA